MPRGLFEIPIRARELAIPWSTTTDVLLKPLLTGRNAFYPTEAEHELLPGQLLLPEQLPDIRRLDV